MITLITGTPGSGKTLYAVTHLLKEIKAKPDRPIFTDIVGLNIEGIEQPPDDWRDAPKGSLIVYDECQFRDAYQRGRGKTKYDYILQLTTHRHDGYDIWLITQSAKFIHLDVLEVVGRHLHLDRPYGAALANVYEWEAAERNPKSRSAKDSVRSVTLFKYNKNIFKYYSSVDVDDDTANHKKFHIPFSQYKWFVIGGLAIAYAIYSFMGNPMMSDKDSLKADQVQQVEATPNPFESQQPSLQQLPPQTPEALEAQRVAFVIASDSGCVAKNSRGHRLPVSHNDCMAYSNDPRLIEPSYVEVEYNYHGNLPPLNQQPENKDIQASSVAPAIVTS